MMSENITSESQQIEEIHQETWGSPIGYLDGVTDGCIYGWCYSGIVGQAQRLTIKVDGETVSHIWADQYRKDLETAGYNAGLCAFMWKIPESLRDGAEHSISIYSTESAEINNSPIRVFGTPLDTRAVQKVSGGPESLLLSNLIVNPELSGIESIKKTVVKGANTVAPSWELFSDSDSAGYIAYWPMVTEAFESEYLTTVRLKSRKTVKLLRIISNFNIPNCYLISPTQFSLFYKNHNKSGSNQLVVKIGITSDDGKFSAVFKDKITLSPLEGRDYSVNIPANSLNSLHRSEGTLNILLECSGDIDIELGKFSFGCSLKEKVFHQYTSGTFEDSIIENQYQELIDFALSKALPEKSNLQKWKCYPGQQLPEIVVPVYDALEHVQICLNSIVDNTEYPHILTIVNDGSTPETAAWLDNFGKDKPWVKVLHNSDNIGYTRTINRAIRESTGSSIVLLNSDTIVSNGWLANLVEVAYADDDIGIVGPLSNAASWQSVPDIKDPSGAWAINQLPAGTSVNDYASIISSFNFTNHPEVPILNGFCFFIKRKVIDTIGLFDEISFPQGYGEENDFCFRAIDAGYKLKIATNTYVFHSKTKSFGVDKRKELITSANSILHEKYGKERFKSLEGILSKLDILEEIRNLVKNH
ncbi:hypothetical protein C4K68_25335 [Pokkaliibacter plantistimulans]|uniref:Glycosyltransferase 2-like domain-containing protein n=1 Tax=Proteobacteria bacterium 228 TaxID=2083153 RepID=A0A2S5KJF5_9PROT|nr:glycosyltransferase family 2 protein [Pokkaliibacter plantistimulans]PPC74639.1 hypothetical protein C4K68_25335 [Pokkaliibacter plantistimulans]